MESLEQSDSALDELAKLSCLRHDQTFMPRFRFADWLKQLLRREPIFFTPVRAALCESR
jgi:hypothetical protein